jgi:hypothetical protein
MGKLAVEACLIPQTQSLNQCSKITKASDYSGSVLSFKEVEQARDKMIIVFQARMEHKNVNVKCK